MIPAELAWLFWDVDPEEIELDRHRDYVVERIMARGNWEAIRWLIRNVKRDALADFLRRKGHHLAPRERAFWSLIADVPCEATPGGGQAPMGGMSDRDTIADEQRAALTKLAAILGDGLPRVSVPITRPALADREPAGTSRIDR